MTARHRRNATVAACGLCVLVLGACTSKPARFRDADAVRVVHDDDPIAMPPRTEVPEWARYSDVYARRIVVGLLDPRRERDAADVNALDEVPTSSWFDADRQPLLDGYASAGMPVAPFEVQPADPKAPELRVMVDATGQRWELVFDEPDRPSLRSSAGAIASRLVFALGYHTAASHIVSLPDQKRALAVRWPAAWSPLSEDERFDLGPTVSTGTRLDDPNDVVLHEDRRTMRALGAVAAWVGLDQIRPQMRRDVYVGRPGMGFVQHQVVSLEDALGAGVLRSALNGDDDGKPPGNAWLALGSFGFAPKEGPDPSETPFPSVGLFAPHVDFARYRPSVPFPPAQDALLGDVYWAAKRIARVPDTTIAAAVRAGEQQPEAARAYVERALRSRRTDIVRLAMSLVTPLELIRVIPVSAKRARGESFELRLDDRAIALGFAKAAESRYEIELYDAQGDPLLEPFELTPTGSTLSLKLSPDKLDERGYVVVRARAIRGESRAPRSAELHLCGSAESAKVRGLRH